MCRKKSWTHKVSFEVFFLAGKNVNFLRILPLSLNQDLVHLTVSALKTIRIVDDFLISLRVGVFLYSDQRNVIHALQEGCE